MTYAVYEEDLWDITLDCWDRILSKLCSKIFWILLFLTLILKHYVLRPWLENYYKETYATRQQRKKRRLRDALNDPVLVIDLENRFLQSFGGDKQKVLQAMEDLRNYAGTTAETDDVADDDHDTKGEEKMQAAKSMWTLTILASMGLFGVLNIAATLDFGYWGMEGVEDECYEFGDSISFFLFSIAHLLHSYVVLRRATKGRNRRPSRSSKMQTETMENNTLEQPLLSSNDD
jgi:hypothetical protein